tara:strand:- start:5532 stop:7208 length:1677 start_codon:yes stop_codon:yes gene_type:complete
MARTKPLPRSQRKTVKRQTQFKREDNIQDISVSLMDMDSTIMYYFENVIKPSVVENGETVKVPVMYSSPERWASIQKLGFMRDAKRQVILPVIAFRRTGMEKDDTMAVDKIDPEDPKLHYSFERKYNPRNRYDAFSVQQGILPQREYYNIAIPDYMVLSYDFIIWTHYIEQMNKLVERINWSAGSYWGEPNRMRFKANIDSYSDVTEVTDRERLIRTEFSVTLKGYLIPEAYNELAGPHTQGTHLTPSQIIVGQETSTTLSNSGIGGETIESLGTSGQSDSFGINLSNAFSITSGVGVNLTNEGDSFDGSSPVTHEISIPQQVETTSNVQFNQVTSSALMIGSNVFSSTGVSQDWSVTGSVEATTTLTVGGNATIGGTLIAQEFHTEYVSGSIILTSGSTQFGDTLDDTHYFTGSMFTSGSFELNGYSINEISNDTTLSSQSSTALVTENALKTYVDTTKADVASFPTYVRKQFVKISTGLTGTNTASFNAITASAPAGLTSTSEHDFLFFINGQYMEHDAIEIQQAASTFLLKVDSDSIGYDLESDDEILAWGKFNS